MLPPITFVVAVNNRQILESNFLASPCLREPNHYQIIFQDQFTSAATAYNDALEQSANDLVVFVHQDVVLPKSWPSKLQTALNWLDGKDPSWGVLGCWGKDVSDNGDAGRGHIYSGGLGVLGRPFPDPQRVQTLDEIVLILRKSSGLRFDERISHFHFYGSDICLAAAKQGRKSYAISAFCIHNTQQVLVLPKEFYESYRQFKRIWHRHLPVQTSCIMVSRSDRELYLRKLRELYLRYVAQREVGARRVTDARRLLEQFEAN